MATKLVVEPIFEADFRGCSYGFRPKRSAQQALEVIRQTANRGYEVVVDADIQSFFDRIDRELLLLEMVAKRISDHRVLRLIRQWLEAGILEDGMVRETLAGTPLPAATIGDQAFVLAHTLGIPAVERRRGTTLVPVKTTCFEARFAVRSTAVTKGAFGYGSGSALVARAGCSASDGFCPSTRQC